MFKTLFDHLTIFYVLYNNFFVQVEGKIDNYITYYIYRNALSPGMTSNSGRG